MRLLPVDAGLNRAILAMAARLFPSGFGVAPDAPGTFKALCRHLDSGAPMIVFDGASEATIYACAETNYALRAWHDWCHWRGRSGFDLAGETAACEMQLAHLRHHYGTVPAWESLLRADIIGQARFYAETRRFVGDQRQFVLDMVARGYVSAKRRELRRARTAAAEAHNA
jgi:hypothetical protein